jgi:hypothetical protein
MPIIEKDILVILYHLLLIYTDHHVDTLQHLPLLKYFQN